jgi:hypothetical protein
MSQEIENNTSLLSGQLEITIDDCDRDEESESKESSAIVQRMIRFAASSLEGFAESAGNKLIDLWRKDPENWRWAVDDYYSREAVDNIRKTVGRFLKLSPVLVGVVPSSEVNIYLREATRCYIYGFFQASIALCRAALEAGLNELLKRRMGMTPQMKFAPKISQAGRFKLLNSFSTAEAHEVRKAARTVLHEKPVSQFLAFDTLARTRGVLLKMYQK